MRALFFFLSILIATPALSQQPPLRSFTVVSDNNQPCTGGDQKITFAGTQAITQAAFAAGASANNWPTSNGLPGGPITDFYILDVTLNLFINGTVTQQMHTFVGHGTSNNNANGDALTEWHVSNIVSGANPINVAPMHFSLNSAPLFTSSSDFLDVHVACPAGDAINAAWLTVWWVPASQ